MDNDDEELIMAKTLEDSKCPCGGERKLTGSAFYTDPLLYEWECPACHARGYVCYESLNSTKIVVRPN